MIITKIIILYFIQIRHTDDFPTSGTRLFTYNVLYVKAMLNLQCHDSATCQCLGRMAPERTR